MSQSDPEDLSRELEWLKFARENRSGVMDMIDDRTHCMTILSQLYLLGSRGEGMTVGIELGVNLEAVTPIGEYTALNCLLMCRSDGLLEQAMKLIETCPDQSLPHTMSRILNGILHLCVKEGGGGADALDTFEEAVTSVTPWVTYNRDGRPFYDRDLVVRMILYGVCRFGEGMCDKYAGMRSEDVSRGLMYRLEFFFSSGAIATSALACPFLSESDSDAIIHTILTRIATSRDSLDNLSDLTRLFKSMFSKDPGRFRERTLPLLLTADLSLHSAVSDACFCPFLREEIESGTLVVTDVHVLRNKGGEGGKRRGVGEDVRGTSGNDVLAASEVLAMAAKGVKLPKLYNGVLEKARVNVNEEKKPAGAYLGETYQPPPNATHPDLKKILAAKPLGPIDPNPIPIREFPHHDPEGYPNLAKDPPTGHKDEEGARICHPAPIKPPSKKPFEKILGVPLHHDEDALHVGVAHPHKCKIRSMYPKFGKSVSSKPIGWVDFIGKVDEKKVSCVCVEEFGTTPGSTDVHVMFVSCSGKSNHISMVSEREREIKGGGCVQRR